MKRLVMGICIFVLTIFLGSTFEPEGVMALSLAPPAAAGMWFIIEGAKTIYRRAKCH